MLLYNNPAAIRAAGKMHPPALQPLPPARRRSPRWGLSLRFLQLRSTPGEPSCEPADLWRRRWRQVAQSTFLHGRRAREIVLLLEAGGTDQLLLKARGCGKTGRGGEAEYSMWAGIRGWLGAAGSNQRPWTERMLLLLRCAVVWVAPPKTEHT